MTGYLFMMIKKPGNLWGYGSLFKGSYPVKLLIYACLFLSLQFAYLIVFPPVAGAEEISKQEIQTALIIKFTEFIKWPDSSFERDSEWFTIAVLGENDYEGLFESFTDRIVQDKKIRVVYYTDDKEIGKVQMLIVSRSARKQSDKLLERLAGLPILTIGDFPGFAEIGGIINFYQKPDNRIGFEINMDAKNLSGIKISSYLLRLAKIVRRKLEPAID